MVAGVFFFQDDLDVRLAFDRVRRDDVGLIPNVPLDNGWSTGTYQANSRCTGMRDRWTGVPLAQKAIGYLLAYPEVASIIPGARSPQQLEMNQEAIQHVLTADEREKLEPFRDDFTSEDAHLLPW